MQAPWTYQGQLEILLEVRQATRVVVLNSHELKIHRAQILVQDDADSVGFAHSSTEIMYDTPRQRCFIHFDADLGPSTDEVLTLWFEGCMNEYMAGFYRSQYTSPSNEIMHMFSTQFEPSEARRAFPCFDEPALKATFDLEIEIPATMTALSNMPVQDSRPSRTGGTIVTFERTPRMSTYLLSWAIGYFDFIEHSLVRRHSSQPLPLRIYTTEGPSAQGLRGLKVACRAIEYFSEIFDIDYPLPKLDLIAVHEMSDDAMENWGLVTFRPTALLYNEDESDPSYLSYMTYIIAHELAHQWFGNLTTMAWWDELWLNEGFATWAGWSACDHLHPEWKVWATFAAEDMQTAFNLDGLRSSHPIKVPIPDGREVDSIFDSISYLKSAAVIRMLAERLGLPTFLKGVSEYLKANAYGTATAVALWEELEKASGENVTSVMTSWVQDVGYPVLNVSEIHDDQISIQQDRFLFAGRPSANEPETTWWVPIQVPTRAGAQRIDLKDRKSVIRQVDTSSFYRLNAGQKGFYMTQLPANELEKFCGRIQQATEEDQVGLLTDVATLAISNCSTTTTAEVLSVILSLKTSKPRYSVLNIVSFCLDRIKSIFSDDEKVSRGLDLLTQDVFRQPAQDLGWVTSLGDNHLTIKARALVLSAAGLAGHAWTIYHALELWDSFRDSQDSRLIQPSLRRSVFSIVMRCRDMEAFDVLREEYTSNTAPDMREIIVEAMSEVSTADLAEECLKFAFKGGMTSSDSSDLLMNLAKNSAARETAWTFMRENWNLIDQRLGGSSAVMEPLVRCTLQTFASEERKAEIEAFFQDKDTTGYTRGLRIALEWIEINAAYRERDGEVLRAWLEERGYI